MASTHAGHAIGPAAVVTVPVPLHARHSTGTFRVAHRAQAHGPPRGT